MGRLAEPKSRASKRALVASPTLLKVLKKHKLSCPLSELDLVFPNEEGKLADPRNVINRHFLPALRQAGLRRIRFHDLRHTYASILIAQGENLKFIQSQLGHSSAKTTLDRYGHLMPEVQCGAGERLESAVFGTPVSKILANHKKWKLQNNLPTQNIPPNLPK
ncbi:MAG: site-specific integrase [Actinomycetota bacterium]|nr:site-specific integrase [Actinomycetota bacterium]